MSQGAGSVSTGGVVAIMFRLDFDPDHSGMLQLVLPNVIDGEQCELVMGPLFPVEALEVLGDLEAYGEEHGWED